MILKDNVVFIMLVSKAISKNEKKLAEEELKKFINDAKTSGYWRFKSVIGTNVMGLKKSTMKFLNKKNN